MNKYRSDEDARERSKLKDKVSDGRILRGRIKIRREGERKVSKLSHKSVQTFSLLELLQMLLEFITFLENLISLLDDFGMLLEEEQIKLSKQARVLKARDY